MSRARDTADQINRINSSAADATAITVDSSENVGIGTDSSYPLTVQSGTAGSNHAIALRNSSNNFSRLGFLQTDSATAAYSSIDGDGRASGYLKFNTNDTERLRIDSDGLKFHGDTAAANALNDYEEGTWLPNIAGNATYLARTGQYIKVGRLVTASFDMTINAINSSAPGSSIGGLPFAAGGSSQGQAGSVSYWSNAASSLTYIAVRVDIGGSSLGLSYTTGAVSTAQLGLSFWKNSARMIGTLTYVTA